MALMRMKTIDVIPHVDKSAVAKGAWPICQATQGDRASCAVQPQANFQQLRLIA